MVNFPTLPTSKKFFSFLKKPLSFYRKNTISLVLRNLTISIAFYGKFGMSWWKKRKKRRTLDTLTTEIINCQVRVGKTFALSRGFSSHIINYHVHLKFMTCVWNFLISFTNKNIIFAHSHNYFIRIRSSSSLSGMRKTDQENKDIEKNKVRQL